MNQQLNNLDHLKTNGATGGNATHQQIVEMLAQLCEQVLEIDRKLNDMAGTAPRNDRTFFTVAEFAELAGKSEYTVREWCRLYRINAEKCDSGHGDSKAWKIPADELARYLDHGLLPIPHRY